MDPNRRQAQHQQSAALQRCAGHGGASTGGEPKGAQMRLTVEGALDVLMHIRSLPTRDGWVRPDPARVPLSLAKALSEEGLLDLRATALGLHEVRLTGSALRMLADAGRVRP